MTLTTDKLQLVTALRKAFGDTVTRQQVISFMADNKMTVKFPHWIFNNKKIRAGRGTYNLATLVGTTAVKETVSSTVSATV